MFNNNKIAVGMAAIPKRALLVPKVVKSLLEQTQKPHKIIVSLNGYRKVPDKFPRDSSVEYRLVTQNDLGDLEKFEVLRTAVEEGCTFMATVDDDILYPPDYLETLFSYSARYNHQYALGVHGRQLLQYPYPESVTAQHDGTMFRYFGFSGPLDVPTQVHIVGTGTMFLPMDRSPVDVCSIRDKYSAYKNTGDVMMAYLFSWAEVGKIVIPRKNRWLQPLTKLTACRTGGAGIIRTAKLINGIMHELKKDRICSMPDGVSKLSQDIVGI